jgi:hypothetical protein
MAAALGTQLIVHNLPVCCHMTQPVQARSLQDSAHAHSPHTPFLRTCQPHFAPTFPADVDEYAVLLSEDYTRLVQAAAASRPQRSGQASPAPAAAAPPAPHQQQPALQPAATQPPVTPSSPLADLFLQHIVPACKGISVEKEELAALFENASSSRRGAPPGGSSSRATEANRQAAAAAR